MGIQWIGLLLTVLAGCAAETAAMKQRRMDDLVTRAAFDLRCDAASLTTTCLKDEQGWCVTAGVEGCDQRAAYVLSQTTAGLHQWVMDSASREGGSPAPSTQPAR